MEAGKVLNQLREVKSYLRLVFSHSLSAVNPKTLVTNELKVINNNVVKVRNMEYKMSNNCYIVGFGKAVLDMARAAEGILKDHIKKGILSIPEGSSVGLIPPKNISVFEGAKGNLPDENALATTSKIMELVKHLDEKDILFVLISGGGSALLPSPIPPITLTEKLELTQSLINKGAGIIEVNTVRKKLSQVKGGKLALLAHPANVVALVLSDVIGDPLDFIASGPTVPDYSTNLASVDILKKYDLYNTAPDSIVDVLKKPDIEINRGNFSFSHTHIIGNNESALNAAKEMSSKDGYISLVMTSKFQGKVDSTSFHLAKLASLICQGLTKTLTKDNFVTEASKLGPLLYIKNNVVVNLSNKIYDTHAQKILLLFGGETSVVVKGSGLGGRNQELALRFSTNVDELSKSMHVIQLFNVVLFCGGTDGIDGPTDAAGAIGYNGQTLLAESQELPYDSYLSENDSYKYFTKLNGGEDLIKIGHTGTNVMDIAMLSIQSKI